MPQDKKLTEQKLTSLWKNKEILELETKDKKIVLFSDIHLGNKSKADDFHPNLKAMERALDYYKKNGFIVILLGDIEELWQFDLEEIITKYDSDIYQKFRSFPSGFLYRIWGNHDSEWGVPNDPARQTPGISNIAAEAIKLRGINGIARILLVHGNQGSVESDKSSWASRFFVRVYRAIEPVIKLDPHKSATKSQIGTDYERILYTWAKQQKVILICGHSHRAIFASESYLDKLDKNIADLQTEIQQIKDNKLLLKKKLKELEKTHSEKLNEEVKNRRIDKVDSPDKLVPCYFNTGCALYEDGITAIEIENDEISLIEWLNKVKNGNEKVIFEKGNLSDIIKRTTG